MSIVGKSEVRVDAFDKATGRTKYYEDRMPSGALYARIKHSEIAHGYVKSIDTSAAEAIEGVVKVLTCFDVPDIAFPTAGHPWSMDPGHQDTADRHLLNRHVRYYGDEVAVVIAENEVAAMQGVLYAGGCYVPIDDHMPEARIRRIFEQVHPVAIVYAEGNRKQAEPLADCAPLISMDEGFAAPAEAERAAQRRAPARLS